MTNDYKSPLGVAHRVVAGTQKIYINIIMLQISDKETNKRKDMWHAHIHASLSWEWASWVRLWIVRARAQAHGQSSVCVCVFLFIFDFNAEPRITFHFSHASACLIYSTPTSSTEKHSLFTLFLFFLALALYGCSNEKANFNGKRTSFSVTICAHGIAVYEHIIFIVLMMCVCRRVCIYSFAARSHSIFFFS